MVHLRYLALAAAALVVAGTHEQLDRAVRADERAQRQRLVLPSLQAVRLLAGGFDKLVSDIYWLGFVQYCGDIDTQRGRDYSRAYDFVNLITGLDPTFSKPYWFGCWAVGYWQRRPDLAARILERGMAANPESWEMPYLAGINEYLFAKNYKLAAHYYRLAAKQKGAPSFLLRHAEILDSPLPELVKRAHMLTAMYDQAHDADYKQAVYTELVSVLENMYRDAPTEITRQAVQGRIDDLKKDFEQWSEQPP